MNRISLKVNGQPVSRDVEPRMHLADFVRESLDLTGTHLGCEHGVCGACTILVDGMPVRSCITFAVTCNGADVITIEGLDDDAVMRELRDAFKREHALQCGFCTPGMLVSARDLVIRSTTADERHVRVAMSGNLCRCTGYVGIIRAIRSVIADRMARGVAPVLGNCRAALGPVGSGHVEAEAPNAVRAAPDPTAQVNVVLPQRVTATPSIERDFVPQAAFDQTFVVRFPRRQVWDMFGRVGDVASCLPGASLIGSPAPEHVEGLMRVKIGPIAAEFRGVADIERDEGSYSGRIVGAGSDVRSSSATRGMISYRLLPTADGQSTQVALTIGYTLTGTLAQVGRAGIVQDVALRLTAAFAQNLEARLGGKAAADLPQADAGLDAGSLMLSVIAGRFREFFKRLFGSQ
jgi:aerobic carbon-monoxide dehydrogenase small subunit